MAVAIAELAVESEPSELTASIEPESWQNVEGRTPGRYSVDNRTHEDMRNIQLKELIELAAKDLEVFKKDLLNTDRETSTTARIRLLDTLHRLHSHVEKEWGVYDADNVYSYLNQGVSDE